MIEELINNLTEKLEKHYIFLDVAKKIKDILTHKENIKKYGNIKDPEVLATELTTHIQKISNDKHLAVLWFEKKIPDSKRSLLKNKEKLEEMKLIASQNAFGVYKLERLAGNVGYIDIRYFFDTNWGSKETLSFAMNYLANTDYIIFDLRNCKGGNPHTVTFVSSFLFDEEPVHLNSIYCREEEKTEEFWTVNVKGTLLPDTPIYVLTSGTTFSGGEEFAYNLQALNRATIIGERTAGGAHPGSPFKIHDHFEIFIPRGRAINPITETNWEGCGVTPDIETPADEALTHCHKTILEDVIKNTDGKRGRPYQKLLTEAKEALSGIEKKEDEMKDEIKTWIFQANPKKYRILDAIADDALDCWRVTRYKNKIKKGHNAIIWMSGKNAGIYAIMKIDSDPYIIETDGEKDEYALSLEYPSKMVAADLSMVKDLSDKPLLKAEIQDDPVLSELDIFKFSQATNFKITEEQWRVVCGMVGRF